MSDMKIQGVVEMSSEGAERAFDRIGQKADSMAAKVTQTSGQAGQAVDQIGAGADRSATEFTRAESRIVSSIKRATTELQNLGKTASQRLELRIDTSGLDKAKFEPLLANLRELEAAQNRVTTSGRGYAGQLQNTSYQLQDFIVQVNGGTDATRALAMQLPQMLIGFGAAGAAIGVVAALLPNLIALFSDSADGAKSLDDAMSGLSDAVGTVGQTVKTFDMTGLYEQFNAANDATRAATIEQLNFQRAFIETQRLVSQKAFSESLSGIGDFSFLDKLSGGGTAASRVADDLGVTLDVAERLAPVLKGLRDGTEDVGLAFTRFGTQLLSGNKQAVELATAMRDLANGEKDAYAASSALSEALDRMAKGYVTIDKSGAGAARSSRAAADAAERLAEAGRDLVQSLLGQSAGLSADFFKKWNLLGAAYKAGAISLQDLTDAQAALLAQQPAMKQAAKDAEEYGKALASTVGALEDRALALESELKNYGLTKSQIERTTIARLEEVRAMAAANGATKDYLANLDREIAARRRIAQATAGIEAEEANRRAAEAAAQDWQRTADAIEKALVDALMDGGKSGKEYIEGLFRSMVLRPIVQAIVQPIAGSLTNAMGFGAPGQGSSGGSFGLPPGLNTTGLLSSGLQWAGSALGSSVIGSFGAGMGMTSAQVAGLSQAGLINGAAASAGSFVASALPYLGLALGVLSMLDFGGGTPHRGAVVLSDGTQTVSPRSDAELRGLYATAADPHGLSADQFRESDFFKRREQGVADALTPIAEAAAALLNRGMALGSGGGTYRVGLGFSADGDDPSRGRFSIIDEAGNELTDFVKKFNKDAQKGMTEFVSAIGPELRDALVAADLPAWIDDILGSLGDNVSIEQLSAVISELSAFSEQATDKTTLWQKATRSLYDEFAALGVEMPQTTAEFNKLIQGSGDLGAELYALALAFYQLSNVVDEVFASISKTTAESVRDIQLAVLDNAGKYEFLDSEIESLLEQLNTAYDPAQIQSLFEQINSKTTQAFNLLDEAEQKRLATQFIDRLYEAEALAQQRLSITPLDYQPQIEAAQAQQQAAQKQSEAADAQKKAANAITSAADAIVKAANRITSSDNSSALAGLTGALYALRPAEVGY